MQFSGSSSRRMAPKYIENIDLEWAADPCAEQMDEAVKLQKVDPATAAQKFEELAAQGSVMAMTYLGDAHKNGRGVPRDIQAGNQWYRRAAGKGSIEAAHRLAHGYFQNNQYDEAHKELLGLSERGYGPASFWLGTFYFVGWGVERNVARAVEFWKKAAARGHLLSERRISILLRSGHYGFWGRVKGVLKIISIIIPYIRCVVNDPRSDRVRDW